MKFFYFLFRKNYLGWTQKSSLRFGWRYDWWTNLNNVQESILFFSIFKKADRDDDGFVTLEDFYNIVTHKVYWDWYYE